MTTTSASELKPRKTIFIAGASGGVGRAILETWRGEDVELYLSANRGAAPLREYLAAQTDSPSLRRARVLQADLALPNAGAKLADELLSALQRAQNQPVPRLDAFVCAAGVDLMTDESRALSFDDRLAKAWQIDVAAPAAIARKLGETMREYKRLNDASDVHAPFDPAMVFFSWDGVERGLKGDSGQIYAACKGAVAGFARSLAHSLAPEVRVNTIAPGWLRTTWGQTASEESTKRYAGQSLLQRWGTGTEAARLVRFLLSDDAAFVNAQTIQLNGGYSGTR